MTGTDRNAANHTPGPWHVGAQNDALYIVAGRAPAPNNDHPWHEAPRVAVAKVYGTTTDDSLPVDADANAHLLAAAPDLLAALREILPFVPIGFASTGRPAGAVSRDAQLQSARAVAVAALSKAEGRHE